jgi:hypothetical protein
MAMVSLDTDCMMAETIGIFREMGLSSCPRRYFTKGVRRDTLVGTHSGDV